MREGRVPALLFAALALLAAALHPGVVDNVDSRVILRTAERLVDDGTWSLGDVAGSYLGSPEYGGRGPDGSHQMKFGPGNALLDVPFLVAGRLLLTPLGLDAHRAGEAGVALASCLWFALSGVLVLRIARRVTSPRGAVGAALLYALTTYALVYARSAYLETRLTVAVLLAYDAALATRERPGDPRPAWILGAAAAAVVWIKAAALLLVAPVLVTALVGVRDAASARRVALRAAVPATLLAAAWLWLNHVRFGHPLETGYSGSARFDRPLADGVVALLFSARGGLLVYAPAALVGIAALPLLARRDRGLAWGTGLALLLALPLYATFFSPFGGDAWGPRYLLPNVALLCVPAACAMAWMLRGRIVLRATAAAIVAAGLALQVPPSLVSFTEFWAVARKSGIDEPPNPPAAVAGLLRAKLAAPDADERPDEFQRPGLPWAMPLTPHLDVWPYRVAKDLPRAATFAWIAWGALVAGAAFAGCRLAARTRELAP